MKARTRLLVLIPILLFWPQGEFPASALTQSDGGQPRIALPDPALLKCTSRQLWQAEPPEQLSIYPARVMMDHFDKSGCPQGMVLHYDKNASFAALKAAINARYSRWEKTDLAGSAISIWRVEPERFVIQLTTIKNREKETGVADEQRVQQLIYLSFLSANGAAGVQPHPQFR